MAAFQFSMEIVLSDANRRYGVFHYYLPSQFLHTHEYYEFILIVSGTCRHHCNGKNSLLGTGDLVFIRRTDTHCFSEFSSNLSALNIVIRTQIIDSMFDYLGPTFPAARLLDQPDPPVASLLPHELECVTASADRLMLMQNFNRADTGYYFNYFILQTFIQHFATPLSKYHMGVPQWLQQLFEAMMKRENFVEGLPAMYRLCGRSPEHLSRMFRKYFDKSPSQVVNLIRLDFAASALTTTAADIIDICNDAGFDSLSHFYHLFKSVYGTTPLKYRKQHTYTG